MRYGGRGMTREEVISGLEFTAEMFLFDPSTGEIYAEPQNDMDKTTIDACRGAIEALEAESDTDYKTLLIKLENAEDVIRGLREDLRDAREELRQRW